MSLAQTCHKVWELCQLEQERNECSLRPRLWDLPVARALARACRRRCPVCQASAPRRSTPLETCTMTLPNTTTFSVHAPWYSSLPINIQPEAPASPPIVPPIIGADKWMTRRPAKVTADAFCVTVNALTAAGSSESIPQDAQRYSIGLLWHRPMFNQLGLQVCNVLCV